VTLETCQKKENVMLKQKSRVELLKGDLNNKFFHSRLRWRRSTMVIKDYPLMGNGVMILTGSKL